MFATFRCDFRSRKLISSWLDQENINVQTENEGLYPYAGNAKMGFYTVDIYGSFQHVIILKECQEIWIIRFRCWRLHFQKIYKRCQKTRTPCHGADTFGGLFFKELNEIFNEYNIPFIVLLTERVMNHKFWSGGKF